jgi:hypothetical protein
MHREEVAIVGSMHGRSGEGQLQTGKYIRVGQVSRDFLEGDLSLMPAYRAGKSHPASRYFRDDKKILVLWPVL